MERIRYEESELLKVCLISIKIGFLEEIIKNAAPVVQQVQPCPSLEILSDGIYTFLGELGPYLAVWSPL
jgi:hypothetical protein